MAHALGRSALIPDDAEGILGRRIINDRSATCDVLAVRLAAFGFQILRGPPRSGKTSLLQLLIQMVQKVRCTCRAVIWAHAVLLQLFMHVAEGCFIICDVHPRGVGNSVWGTFKPPVGWVLVGPSPIILTTVCYQMGFSHVVAPI